MEKSIRQKNPESAELLVSSLTRNNENDMNEVTSQVNICPQLGSVTSNAEKLLAKTPIADSSERNQSQENESPKALKSQVSSTRALESKNEETLPKNKPKQNIRGRNFELPMMNYSEVTFCQCFICEKSHQRTMIFSVDDCDHLFCRKCGKIFYEDKIEQGETDLTCPKFNCESKASRELIQFLVSEQHFKALLDEEAHDTKFKNVIKENKDIKLKLKNKFEDIKIYIQPHVIDINTNETFYIFNKAKINFCPNCGENALFSKSGNHFIKCLNCDYMICKYCLKVYTPLHMDISVADHCKVFYRKSDRDESKSNFCKLYLIQLFLTIASFIMVFIGWFHYIFTFWSIIFCQGRKKKLKNMNCFVSFLVFTFGIIFFLIGFPVILVSFPYFPVFIEAIG